MSAGSQLHISISILAGERYVGSLTYRNITVFYKNNNIVYNIGFWPGFPRGNFKMLVLQTISVQKITSIRERTNKQVYIFRILLARITYFGNRKKYVNISDPNQIHVTNYMKVTLLCGFTIYAYKYTTVGNYSKEERLFSNQLRKILKNS